MPPKKSRSSEPGYEERLQRAIKAVKSGQEVSVPNASEAFDVDLRTLYRRIAGTSAARNVAHEEQQRLTSAEEKALVKFCFDQDDRGFPARLDMIRDMAIHLERKRIGCQPTPLGKHWIPRFLKRQPALAIKLSSQLERQRAYANNPRVLQDYFGKLGRLIRRHGLKAFQIFNMDEKGFLMGLAARAKVLCRRGRRNPRVTHDGGRQLVTVIETICGNGAVLNPFVINKGAGHYLGWYKNLTSAEHKYQFSYSPKGWTDDILGMEWLEKIFEPESRAICGNGVPRLLVFDGHGSHITYNFIQYCLNHDIILLCLPSHSTHLLQPLDVGLFGPYQHFYGQAVDEYTRSGQNTEGIKKAIFIPFLTFARTSTFTTHNILQSFVSTGIWPLNARRVMGKALPTEPKRRDTFGVVKHPETGPDIRHHILAATNLLGSLNLEKGGTDELISERVQGILKDLGHQLEEEIAGRAIWQQMTHRLQGVEKVYNATDRRKLSEARVLNGLALESLRDIRLAKDAKSEAKKAGKAARSSTTINVRPRQQKKNPRSAKSPLQALPLLASTPPLPDHLLTTGSTPQIVFIDLEDGDDGGSDVEELSDQEWEIDPPATTFHRITRTQTSPDQTVRSYSLPDQPLHMSLRSRRPPLPNN